MVTVLALAPLLAILHRASVRHAICEHGDLIEPDHGSEHGSATAGTASDIDEQRLAPAARPDEAPAVHSHDHCAMATLARAGAAIAASGSNSLSVSWSDYREPPAGETSAVRAVLANAPKTSPPVVRVSLFA